MKSLQQSQRQRRLSQKTIAHSEESVAIPASEIKALTAVIEALNKEAGEHIERCKAEHEDSVEPPSANTYTTVIDADAL